MIRKKILLVLVSLVVIAIALPCLGDTVTYEYDNLYRLIKATYSDGTVIEYTYDAAGNRLAKVVQPGDSDGDGLPDALEATTCTDPQDPDTDNDGLLDGAEDADADGVVDTGETDPCNADTEGDGMPDGWEVQYGLDPLTDDAAGDLDGDGITNLEEYNQGTDPTISVEVDISADPTSIQEGESSTLTWTSTNATECTIDQGIGSVDPNDSTTVSPTETTTYTITATGPGGTATDSATVTVTTPPTPETLTLRPNASGDHTGITKQQPSSGSHYDKVDDVTADDDSTYLYEVYSTYKYDLYGIPDHTTESGAINYIKVYYRVRMSYSSTGYFKAAIKTGDTVYYGTETSHSLTTWATYSYTWDTNPYTGTAWTWDDIDALQIGIAMKPRNSRCTQVYVEVNYTP